jgi:heme exporter protein A
VARVEEMLARVGLADRADDPVRSYSRGMRQRLSIARALLHEPDLILLDEPYTGLDQSASRKLRDILSGIRSRGGTVVMVTHHLEEGLWLSTRIGIMADGRLRHEQEAAGLSRDQLSQIYRGVVDADPS